MAEQLTEQEQDLSKTSKVLIFTAPIVCVDCIQKETNKGKPGGVALVLISIDILCSRVLEVRNQ